MYPGVRRSFGGVQHPVEPDHIGMGARSPQVAHSRTSSGRAWPGPGPVSGPTSGRIKCRRRVVKRSSPKSGKQISTVSGAVGSPAHLIAIVAHAGRTGSELHDVPKLVVPDDPAAIGRATQRQTSVSFAIYGEDRPSHFVTFDNEVDHAIPFVCGPEVQRIGTVRARN